MWSPAPGSTSHTQMPLLHPPFGDVMCTTYYLVVHLHQPNRFETSNSRETRIAMYHYPPPAQSPPADDVSQTSETMRDIPLVTRDHNQEWVNVPSPIGPMPAPKKGTTSSISDGAVILWLPLQHPHGTLFHLLCEWVSSQGDLLADRGLL
jgi:hypothetical protein